MFSNVDVLHHIFCCFRTRRDSYDRIMGQFHVLDVF